MEVNSLIAALESGDFHTALPLLENMTSDQLSELTLPDKCTPLHYACRHGRVDVAQQLITHCKYSIESKDGKRRTPLHTAAQYGQVSTLKYLLHNLFMNEESSLSLRLTSKSTLSRSLSSILELKLSDRHRDESGNTPLHTACVHGQLDIVQLLISEIGCNPNDANNITLSMYCKSLVQQHSSLAKWKNVNEEMNVYGMFPISLAAGGGHLDIIKYLIEEKGVELHFLSSGVSPVLTASCGGHLHVIKYLFEKHGLYISHDDREVILFYTCLVGHMDIVTYLITEADYDPHCTSTHKVSCLGAACLGGHLNVVKYLVDTHNCDPVKDKLLRIAASNGRLEFFIAASYSHTILAIKSNIEEALHNAAINGHLEVTKFFIEDMKFDPNCKDHNGRIPLHHASEGGHLDVVKYLVKAHHCDPLCLDTNKMTPLHSAVIKRQSIVVKYLISTLDCVTPLHCTAIHNNLRVVKFFIEDLNFRYYPNCKSQLGRTALHHASEGGHLDVVKYLVDTHHCDPLCPDRDNFTSLHLAAANGRLEVVSYFVITQDCNLLIKDKYNDTPLHVASSNGHLEVVKFFIEDMKCNPICKCQYERTPLHHASEGGHLDIVKYLVNIHHCDPLCPDINNMTPLHSAASKWQSKVVKYLIRRLDCNTPLHIAALYNNLEVVKFFVNNLHYDPKSKNELGRTPLHHASEGGHLDVVKYLVDTHYCDPLCPDTDIITPLHSAAIKGRSRVVKFLIRRLEFYTPLHCTAIHNNLRVVKFFIEDLNFRYDPNCKSQLGRTPLHHASEGGHLDVVKYLVETHHCDPLCPDIDNETPLHRAVANGRLEVVSYFVITQDCNLLIKDKYNNTPLQVAYFNGHLEVVKFFIEVMKCNPICKFRYERTALHHASEGGHLDVVKYLVNMHHCDPLCPDIFNMTPLHCAASKGQSKVVKYLISRLDCSTPLHLTALHKNLEAVKYFVNNFYYDPKYTCIDKLGRTPLHLASEGGHLDVVNYLVDIHHCDPLCPDTDNMTPLHSAAIKGRSRVVKFLITRLDCNTPLHIAALCNNLEVVKFFVNNLHYDPKSKNELGRTPLHHASEGGHLDVVKYLVDTHHCDPLCPDTDKITPLHSAAIKGRSRVAKYLISTLDCDTPLHCTAIHNNLRLVKFFIEDLNFRYDPNCKSQLGRTPLHHASEGGHLDVVKYLVNTHHCDPLCPDRNNFTPLHRAAANGRLEVVSYFVITQNCNLLIIDNTPLHVASSNGRLEVVKFFIEDMKCYNSSCKDQYERTPLHHASEGGHLDVVKYLVNTHCACDISCIKDKYNDTPLHDAASSGHLEIVRFFIEDMKCDPNCKGRYEKIPLHHASEGGHLDVVKYFVDTHHCDPLCPDENSKTPLYSAALYRNSKVVRYFISTLKYITPLHLTALYNNLAVIKFFIIDLEYDPKSKNQLGRTPLHHASEGGHLDVVKYLVDTHHCDPLCPDNENMTPLHTAALKNHSNVVIYLISTLNYSTPLHLTALHNNLEVVKFFMESEVFKYDPNCENQIRRTPLHYASEGGHLDAVKYLVDTHHCDPLYPDRDKTTPLHLAAAKGQLEVVRYFASIRTDCDLQVKNAEKYSPLDIASIRGHHEVELFLLRATTTKPVLQRDIISPSLNIFVIGNSGSGKSTLVKALSDKGSLLGFFFSVKNVTPLTAGIVPTTINSGEFGTVNIYDFAGHEEYYASHEIVLQQTSHPLVLLTVDISLPQHNVEQQLLYWLSVLSNYQSCHVIVIGSHADQVKFKERSEVMKNVTTLLGSEQSITFCGFIQCDCRYSSSDFMDKLRHKLSSLCRILRKVLANGESFDVNRLCACLMYYLKHDIPAQPTITVSEVKRHIIAHNDNSSTGLNQLEDQNLLFQTCKNLSSSGHLFLIPHDENPENSLLVLKNNIILDKVHACLTDIKNGLSSELGIVNENQLTEILSKSLKDVMEPEHAIKYLIFAQFCTEIAADQLISLPNGEENVTHYFFPNLVSASRPPVLLSLGEKKYTKLSTWCLKCTHVRHFFTPRYLHILFIQLIKCERNEVMSECKIWKNGILIVRNNGTRSIIEVTDQTTQVFFAIQCVEGFELQLVKQRSQLVTLIKSLVLKTCPNIEVKEFLLLSQNNYPPEIMTEISMAKVACSVIESAAYVSYKDRYGMTINDDNDALEHVLVTDLLFFDPFHIIKDEMLRNVFAHHLSDNVVPLATVKRIHRAVETCRELQEWFEDEAGQCRRDITYSQLYRELIKYSIFTDGNLYVS